MKIPDCLEGRELTGRDMSDLRNFVLGEMATGTPDSKNARKAWKIARRFVRGRMRRGLLAKVSFFYILNETEPEGRYATYSYAGQAIVIHTAFPRKPGA